MCLAVPMKVLSIEGNMGTVEAWGVRREADLAMVQPVNIGDYVLVHAGFAIQTMDEEEAMITLETLKEVAEMSEQDFGDASDTTPRFIGKDPLDP